MPLRSADQTISDLSTEVRSIAGQPKCSRSSSGGVESSRSGSGEAEAGALAMEAAMGEGVVMVSATSGPSSRSNSAHRRACNTPSMRAT